MKRIAGIVCLSCVSCMVGTVSGQEAPMAELLAAAAPPSVSVRVEGEVEARGGATLVTVHRKGAPAEVFADLGKQAGVRFVPWPDELWDLHGVKTIALDADHQPFWVVALRAADACGLSIRRSVGSDENTVELHATKGASLRQVSGGGPLTIVAESVRRQSKTEAGDGPAGLILGLRVYADPSLKNCQFMGAALDEATDDLDNSLIPDKQDKSALQPSAALVSLHEVPLANLAQPGKFVKTVRGSLTLLVAGESDDFAIDPAIKTVQARQIGRFTYSCQGLNKDAQGYELLLNVKGPADEMSVAIRELIVSQQSILPTDAGGNRYRIGDIAATYTSKAVTDVGNAMYSVRLRPEKADAGEISTITWRLPKQISTQEVHFEFHDLPMP